MWLKFNQCLFGVFLFGLKCSLFISALFSFLLTTFIFIWGGNKDYGMVLGVTFYIVPICFVCCAMVFAMSIVSKKYYSFKSEKFESYFWISLAALMANVLCACLIGVYFTYLHLTVYLASAISIYVGAKFYRSTWKSLTEILQKH